MKISQLLWDAETVDHIARHAVLPAEVEEAVFEGNKLTLKGREGRYVILSRSLAGRYLTIIIAFKFKGRAKVITARDMDEKERTLYQRRNKSR